TTFNRRCIARALALRVNFLAQAVTNVAEHRRADTDVSLRPNPKFQRTTMSFRFTTIDEPNAVQGPELGTEVFGISLNTGVVAGGYTPTGSTSVAFDDFLGNFTTLGGPPGALATYATDVNDQGHVVGIFADAGGLHGYFEAGGSFSPFDDPSAVKGTFPAAI